MFRNIPLAVIAAMLVLSTSAVAGHSAGDPLDFVLTINTHQDSSGKIMLQEAHGPGGIVELNADKDCQLWSSGQPAAVALSFPAQNVDYTLNTILGPFVDLTVSVGVVSGGVYNDVADLTDADASGTIPLTDSMALSAGDFVGFRVCADFTGVNTAVDISTQDGSSLVTFTESPPPTFPTPELGTLLLSGVGLMAVAGTVVVKRREL